MMNVSHTMLPMLRIDDAMNALTQAWRESGRSMYGRTICDGVCWAMNRSKKSIVRMNGIMQHRNSIEVVERDSLANMATGMDNPIKYMNTNDVEMYSIALANFVSVAVRLRRSANLR